MGYLLHLDTKTQNSHLDTSGKKKREKGFTIHDGTHGEYISFKENDSETEVAAAETPCEFNLKCQGFYTDGGFN